jgi:hypothetical protein
MQAQEIERLRLLAARYVWWKTADDALRYPARVVAQVMNVGVFEDVQLLSQILSEEVLRGVLRQAEVGQFTPRSWHYWHYRLGLSRPGEVPPLPIRETGSFSRT